MICLVTEHVWSGFFIPRRFLIAYAYPAVSSKPAPLCKRNPLAVLCDKKRYAQWSGFAMSAKKELEWEVDGQTGCWNVTSHCLNMNGYAVLCRDGKEQLAHRWMYEQMKGTVPPDKCVCHSCDNPRCVNPDHLWLGTHIDNMQDRERKGRTRWPQGEKHYNAKLTEDQVIYIRSHMEISQTQMARVMGVTQSHVSLIRLRKSWRHLP